MFQLVTVTLMAEMSSSQVKNRARPFIFRFSCFGNVAAPSSWNIAHPQIRNHPQIRRPSPIWKLRDNDKLMLPAVSKQSSARNPRKKRSKLWYILMFYKCFEKLTPYIRVFFEQLKVLNGQGIFCFYRLRIFITVYFLCIVLFLQLICSGSVVYMLR
jgi:hypothetical protein